MGERVDHRYRAGASVQGFEKAVRAVNIHDHTPTLLLRLPETTHIIGFAHSPDGTVFLLTDIRGNAQTSCIAVRVAAGGHGPRQ